MLTRQLGPSLVVHAPAKLNLFLEIISKRPDGYHDLETVMVTVGIHDRLDFTEEDSDRIKLEVFPARQPSNTGRIGDSSCGGESEGDVPADRRNLVVQAAELLRGHAGIRRGVRMRLFKRIPVAAGLAGGSSDAAAALAALDRLWKLNLPSAELAGLAARLGSDVSFFLSGAPSALCRGRGEIVEPLSIPLGWHFLIACPRPGLSTADVYSRCPPSAAPRSAESLAGALRGGRLSQAGRLMHNALQEPAESLNPRITELMTRLSRFSAWGRLMSGSGPACFGVFPSRRAALRAAARLRAAWGGYVFAARSGC